MIIVVLLVLGLCFGSFVNALVWRVHEQDTEHGKKNPNKKYLKQLSISRGRSMCSQCHHELEAKDLLPVVSWVSLKGKCRYCGKPIPDSPLVELATAGLFIASYIWWPYTLTGLNTLQFGLWLALLVGFMALTVYDLRWYLLPNRLMYPVGAIAAVFGLISVHQAFHPLTALLSLVLAVVIGGGIFYVLFQISGGKWIGGGDVKLGWQLGLVVLAPVRSLLFIFVAALAGSLVSIPLLMRGKLQRSAIIPFGPFLILGAIVVVLFGSDILSWYQHLIIVG